MESKVYYQFHKGPPLDPILGPDESSPHSHNFFMIYFNIIIPSTPSSPM